VILIVDDNRELCETLAEFLTLQGHAVQCAGNGSEALRLVADSRTRPAVILLDLEMPILDGWGFLAERGKDPLLADAPVVIMSAFHDVAQKAEEAGAVAVLLKPMDPQTLLRVIEHFAKRP
jgi:two-component system chemotaxis response regulator CheY